MKVLAEERADIYRIFSNDKRILIFWLISEEEMSVNDIAETIGTSIQNTSQHLRLMKDKGIVKSRRNGKEIYYQVTNNDVGNFCRQINMPGHNMKNLR